MKILICTPYGLSVPCGNTIAARRLGEGFSANGHEVSILDDCQGVSRAAARDHAKRFGPDVVVVMHAWRCAEVFYGILPVTGGPVVVSLRGTDINEMFEDETTVETINTVLRQADAITVFTERMRERLIARVRIFHSKIYVIPNGLSIINENGDFRQKLGMACGVPVIVGVAGIRKEKGVILLLEYLEHLRTRIPDLVYLHAGPVLDEREGMHFLEISGRMPWIIYAGTIPHEDVGSFLRTGTIFTSCSRSEGMPHAVREAMGMRLPCLLSDIEGHKSMAIGGKEALFFNDRRSFIDKAQYLFDNEAFRRDIGDAAQKRILTDYGKNREIDRYLDLFKVLLSPGAGRIRHRR